MAAVVVPIGCGTASRTVRVDFTRECPSTERTTVFAPSWSEAHVMDGSARSAGRTRGQQALLASVRDLVADVEEDGPSSTRIRMTRPAARPRTGVRLARRMVRSTGTETAAVHHLAKRVLGTLPSRRAKPRATEQHEDADAHRPRKPTRVSAGRGSTLRGRARLASGRAGRIDDRGGAPHDHEITVLDTELSVCRRSPAGGRRRDRGGRTSRKDLEQRACLATW